MDGWEDEAGASFGEEGRGFCFILFVWVGGASVNGTREMG